MDSEKDTIQREREENIDEETEKQPVDEEEDYWRELQRARKKRENRTYLLEQKAKKKALAENVEPENTAENPEAEEETEEEKKEREKKEARKRYLEEVAARKKISDKMEGKKNNQILITIFAIFQSETNMWQI